MVDPVIYTVQIQGVSVQRDGLGINNNLQDDH